MREMIKWQAEQAPYPLDVDYCGESSYIFDLEAATEQIVGKLNGGDTFIYLFRRFGYPRFGWDDQKQLVLYRITTPMPGVILLIEPDVTGAFTFAYILRKDIAEAYAEEDRKPFTERYKRFEAWAIAKGIETIHTYYEPDNDKLQRVWRTWTAANEDNDFETQNEAEQTFYNEQAEITATLLKEYAKIEPYAKPIPLMDQPDNSIMKQCHMALCKTIKDLLRPVHVRDVMINIKGKVVWDESLNQDQDAVKCAAGSGCGVGDKLEINHV
jgi:hypothetical protein